jgi:hyperosmotically inducible protein
VRNVGVSGVKDIKVDMLTVKESKQPLKDTYITAKVKGLLLRADILG